MWPRFPQIGPRICVMQTSTRLTYTAADSPAIFSSEVNQNNQNQNCCYCAGLGGFLMESYDYPSPGSPGSAIQKRGEVPFTLALCDWWSAQQNDPDLGCANIYPFDLCGRTLTIPAMGSWEQVVGQLGKDAFSLSQTTNQKSKLLLLCKS